MLSKKITDGLRKYKEALDRIAAAKRDASEAVELIRAGYEDSWTQGDPDEFASDLEEGHNYVKIDSVVLDIHIDEGEVREVVAPTYVHFHLFND